MAGQPAEEGGMAERAATAGGLPDGSIALPALEAHRRGPRGDARDGRPGGRGASARLRAEAQLLRPRRRHRAGRRGPAPPVRAPRGRRGDHHLAQGAGVLRWRQHPHAEPVRPRLEGELLQVHERDAERDRGGQRVVRPALPHRRERALCRRRLRAGAGDRLDHDGRRRQHGRVPPGGPAPGRAPRYRRTHAPDRQAPRPAGPGGRLLHAGGGHQGTAGGGVGAGRRGVSRSRLAEAARERAAQLAERSDRPAAARGIAALAPRPDDRGGPDRLRPPDLRDRSEPGRGGDHRGGAGRCPAGRPRRASRRGRRASGRWRWRGSWTTWSSTSAPTKRWWGSGSSARPGTRISSRRTTGSWPITRPTGSRARSGSSGSGS